MLKKTTGLFQTCGSAFIFPPGSGKIERKKKLKKFKEIDNNCNFNYFIKNVKVNLDQLFVFYYRYF